MEIAASNTMLQFVGHGQQTVLDARLTCLYNSMIFERG